MRESPTETTRSRETPGFALNQADIDEFKIIVRKECGTDLTDHEAWNRVIELLNLYRSLLGPIPEDPEASRPLLNSHSVALALKPTSLPM